MILSFVLVGFGSIGYMLIEQWSFIDALYMTIITLTTVGYGEVNPVTFQGRIFTVILIVLGGSYFLYMVGSVMQFLVEGRIRTILGRHKLDKQINRLKDHYIICGYGRIGKVLSSFLIEKYINVVVIEQNPSSIEEMNDDGILYLIGSATDEKLLEKAGIHNAQGLITVVGTDADNVFLVLIAKQMNPDLFIVARASQNSAKKTLMAAGANKVISPYDIGARRMAHAILRPTVIKFLEMAFSDENTDIVLEEIHVKESSPFVGVSLMDSEIRQTFDLIIITISKADGTMLFNPGASTKFDVGDIVVAVGKAKNLIRLERILGG